MLGDLYNTDILGLAASLRNARLSAPCGSARKVSKLCGSELEIDIAMDKGVVTDCALRVQACALGQASAAILKANIVGAHLSEIMDARNALYGMLKDRGQPPTGRFEALKVLAGVAEYPARHTSALLAFDAAVDAVKTCQGDI